MALDRVALVFKIGDKITAEGNEHLGVKHEQPICWIDEADWGLSLEDILGPNSGRVFANVEVNRSLIPKLREWCKPTTNNEKDINYRPRAVKLPFSKLEQRSGIIDLKDRLNTKEEIVPLINGTMLTDTDFEDATLKPNIISVPDLNLITSGDHDVGVGEPVYTTLAIAYADLGSPFTGDLSFRIISDITETARANVTENIATYHFRTYGSVPVTNAVTGWTLSINHTSDGIWYNPTAADASRISQWDNFRMKSTGGAEALIISESTPATIHICRFFNLVLDGNSDTGNCVWFYTPQSRIHQWYNVIAYNAASREFYWSGGFPPHAGSIFENMTADGINGTGSGFQMSNLPVNLRNCLSIRHNPDFHGLVNSTGYNTAAEDTTNEDSDWSAGSGNVSNIDVSATFVSLNPLSADYLKLQSDNTELGWGGSPVEISTNTVGIRGQDRPYYFPSIGADQLELSASMLHWQGISGTNYSSAVNYIENEVPTSASIVILGTSAINDCQLTEESNCKYIYADSNFTSAFDQNGQILNSVKGIYFHAGSTLTLDSSAVVTDDGGFVVSSGWDTLNVSAAELDLRGTGTIGETSDIIINKLTLANNGQIITSNGSTGIGSTELVVSGGTWINNSVFSATINSSDTLVFTDGNTIEGTGDFIIEVTSAMTFDVSGMNTSAFTGSLYIRTNITTSAATFNLNEPISTGGDFYLYRRTGKDVNFIINENLSIDGTFNFGNEL